MYVKTLYGIELDVLKGTYEPDVIAVIRDHVRPGMTAIDVGANVGATAVALADQVGSTGKVFAFEPGPTTFARLLRNVDLNPSLSGIIHPINEGCAEKPGELVYHELANARGNAILGDLDPRFGAHASHRVAVTTIDEFVESNRIRKIDFVKIDVEWMVY